MNLCWNHKLCIVFTKEYVVKNEDDISKWLLDVSSVSFHIFWVQDDCDVNIYILILNFHICMERDTLRKKY